MDAAVAIVGADNGTLQLLEGESLRIVAHHGHTPAFLKFFASAESRASVCGEASHSGERVIVDDVETSPLFADTESLAVLREAGVRAVQSTPLLGRKGDLLGIARLNGVFACRTSDLWRLDLRQAADFVRTQAKAALRRPLFGGILIRCCASVPAVHCFTPMRRRDPNWRAWVVEGKPLQGKIGALIERVSPERPVIEEVGGGARIYCSHTTGG
jgi:hypothetical protein